MKSLDSGGINFGLNKPIFIIGSPRSGTTFLGSVFSAIPETEYFYLLLFPPHLAHCVASGNCNNIAQFLKWNLVRNFADALGDRIRSRGQALISMVRGDIPLIEMFRRHKRSINEIRLVYKEPFLTFIPKFIYETFPGCQIIHIVRDGRDVASSFMQKYNVFEKDNLANMEFVRQEKYGEVAFPRMVKGMAVPWWVEKNREDEFLKTTQYHRAIWFWRTIVSKCMMEIDSCKTINASNFLEIRYENLCRKPRTVGNKIIDFLNVEPGWRFFRRLKGARLSSIGKHKKYISRYDIEIGEKEAGDLLDKLGYLSR